ncbi:hypothetical protein Tsubulata_000539 [Turnera subulata]|uniref:starch synthase n=1 Tax=Turnera subulata TaxID=218843 RepID=A0A9Q0J9I8_9ROSI|nr:hypothetical protein Tsubulata_000539 [Turnera subulata]
MGTLLSAAILSPSPVVPFSKPTTLNPKPHLKPPSLVCCLREEDHDYEDISRRSSGSLDFEPEEKSRDVWKLFREAQQNILLLNKQRLVAVEELKKAQKEKALLVDRIQQLESEKPSVGIKALSLSNFSLLLNPEKLSLRWELLLRIDSMVLTGMINTAEASGFRKMVVNDKHTVPDIFFGIMQKSDAELLAELRHFSDGSKMNGFHIIHICSEMAPLVVGSMASYLTGLSHALQKKGHLVEVILPKYAFLDLSAIHGLRQIEAESYSYFNGQLHENKIWTGVVHGIGVTLIEPLYYWSFFNRERLYGYSDDFERFTYFSRASLDYIVKSGKRPDVLHIHNWETAIVGPLFWDIFVNQGLGGTRIMLTCHGFNSQCLEQPEKLELCGLDPARLHRPDRLQDNAKTHLVNILKGGIVYSNKVIMVSSIHSKGRMIRSFSHGLEPTLAIHKDKLIITPIGFDNSIWDPSKDRFLPENYSADDMEGKAVCKVALQQQLGLTEKYSTLLVSIGYRMLNLLLYLMTT